MVNSKKMSKSSIAVLVLAILLVLSMVAGLTGAWFNAHAEGSQDSGAIKFGTVSVTKTDATISYAGAENVGKVVDGDTWAVGANSFANESDVQVFYKVVYSVDLYSDAGNTLVTAPTERSYWDGLTPAKTTYGYLTAGESLPAGVSGAAGTVTFNDDGNVTNASKETRYLYAKVSITAVQAGNVDNPAIKTALGCTDGQATALKALRDAKKSAVLDPSIK